MKYLLGEKLQLQHNIDLPAQKKMQIFTRSCDGGLGK